MRRGRAADEKFDVGISLRQATNSSPTRRDGPDERQQRRRSSSDPSARSLADSYRPIVKWGPIERPLRSRAREPSRGRLATSALQIVPPAGAIATTNGCPALPRAFAIPCRRDSVPPRARRHDDAYGLSVSRAGQRAARMDTDASADHTRTGDTSSPLALPRVYPPLDASQKPQHGGPLELLLLIAR